MDTVKLPQLPVEVVMHIFRYAAIMSKNKRRCLVLILVSKWARAIALPYLLSSITFTSPRSLQRFERYLTRGPSRPLPYGFDHRACVRSLWLPPTFYDQNDAVKVISLCQNLTHLSLSAPIFGTLVAISASNAAHVQRTLFGPRFNQIKDETVKDLSVTVYGSSYFWARQVISVQNPPIFLQAITHIHFTELAMFQTWPEVAYVPSLTHLALPFNTKDETVALLSVIRNAVLERLVLLMDVDEEMFHQPKMIYWMKKYRESDTRVLYACWNPQSVQKDWRDEVQGGQSIWKRAIYETGELLYTRGRYGMLVL